MLPLREHFFIVGILVVARKDAGEQWREEERLAALKVPPMRGRGGTAKNAMW
jgi:hypothetical protein